jgi:hypothetical protein
MITLLLIVLLLATAAVFHWLGMWAALVTFVNVLVAAALATAWYEWLAGVIEGAGYLADFLSAWILFAIILGLIGEATNRVSRTRVWFPEAVDRFGAPVVGLMVGWVLICFTATTLHLAPVPRGLVQPGPEDRLFLGLAPDRKWLQFVRTATRQGPFSHPGEANANVFDDKADFILRSADRRKKLEGEQSIWAKP